MSFEKELSVKRSSKDEPSAAAELPELQIRCRGKKLEPLTQMYEKVLEIQRREIPENILPLKQKPSPKMNTRQKKENEPSVSFCAE